jgi:hypothetical protein
VVVKTTMVSGFVSASGQSRNGKVKVGSLGRELVLYECWNAGRPGWTVNQGGYNSGTKFKLPGCESSQRSTMVVRFSAVTQLL